MSYLHSSMIHNLTYVAVVDLCHIHCQVACRVKGLWCVLVPDSIEKDEACISPKHVIVGVLELGCWLIIHLVHGEHGAQLDANQRDECQDDNDGCHCPKVCVEASNGSIESVGVTFGPCIWGKQGSQRNQPFDTSPWSSWSAGCDDTRRCLHFSHAPTEQYALAKNYSVVLSGVHFWIE